MKSFLIQTAGVLSVALLGLAATMAQGQNTSSSADSAVIIESGCHDAWKESSAQSSCTDPYSTPGGWGGISVHADLNPPECTVKSACDMDNGACCYAAAFKGTKTEISTLQNCNGELQPGTC